MGAVDAPFVAASPLYELHQPQVAIVVRVGGPLGPVRDVLEIVPGIWRQVTDLRRCKGRIPPGRVVGPTLPRIEYRNEPRPLGVPLGQEVSVPEQELGVALAGKPARLQPPLPRFSWPPPRRGGWRWRGPVAGTDSSCRATQAGRRERPQHRPSDRGLGSNFPAAPRG